MCKANEFAKQLHAEFGNAYGCDFRKPEGQLSLSDPLDYRAVVAGEFLRRPSEPDNPLVKAAYAAFEAELYAQFEFLVEKGVRFNFTWDDPVDPETGKPSYCYTKRRFEETGVLDVFRTKFGEHPVLAMDFEYRYGGEYINGNDLFRAVHDFLGHLASGGSFGERGEKRAYLSHYQLFGPLARRALYTETVAQNAVFNHTKQFAPQKVMLFPYDYHAVPMS